MSEQSRFQFSYQQFFKVALKTITLTLATIYIKGLLIRKRLVFPISVCGGIVFNANSAIFQLYQGENKLIFNEMMIISALD
jgi:hypothetical protein